MSDGTIERAKVALARFIQTSHPQDEFSLIGFSSSPQLLLDRVRDGHAVLNKFTYVNPTGNTGIYDAVSLGIDKVTQGVYPKQAIILISDGEENNSRCSFSKLRRKLEESGVVVYTVRVGMLPLPKSIGGMVMDQIAAASGGKSFWPKNSERMDEAFEQIAVELRRQYSIGYLPTNFVADGKLHKIKVSLTLPEGLSGKAVVRHREGYYAVTKLTAR
jgi:Ca-activated chloride channel family protein